MRTEKEGEREREKEKRERVLGEGGGLRMWRGAILEALHFFIVHSMFFSVFFEVVGAVLRGMDQIPATVV